MRPQRSRWFQGNLACVRIRFCPLVAPELTMPLDQSRSFHSFWSKARTGPTGLRVLSVVDPSGNPGIPCATYRPATATQSYRYFQFLPLLSTPNLCSTRLIKPRIRIGCLSRRTVWHSHLCKKKCSLAKVN
jgi:hypothetical protein